MHFWIDKRSQACGFGRARVAASLSSSGFDFYNPPRPPRRIGGKSIVTPIHRFQSVDCRPYFHRQNHHTSNNSQNHSNRQIPHGNQSQHHQPHQPHQQQQPSINTTTTPTQRYHHSRRQHSSLLIANRGEPAECSDIQQYQSHALEMEHGSLGIHSVEPSRVVLSDDSNALATENADTLTADSQILPSHLKCGMWASLALATVFIAAFQGSGLEVLIFCAFSATFFLAACIVSLCRRPRDLNISTPQINQTPTNVNDLNHIAQLDQPDVHVITAPDIENVIDPMLAPPPPYNIAILATENSKDIDESPPPSYDKIVI